MSVNQSSANGGSIPFAAGHFRFITMQAPDDAKNQKMKRLARSHAVKQALESKRKFQQESGENFRATTFKNTPKRPIGKRLRSGTLAVPIISLGTGVIDPFQTLAVDSLRLQMLLSNNKARQAPEPVFSVAKELAFQDFHSVFRTGLVDPALLNAVMLSLAFAVNGGNINRECLGFQGQAMRHIRERMSSLDMATSESTIGAILLLAGIEARLGMTSQVQLHMEAVQLLLEICETKVIHLTGGIKRAIFWQDLNSSILAGSSRIVNHTTFAELTWTRDSFSPNDYRLPPGFQARSHLFTKEFVVVLEDVNALQLMRDVPRSAAGDAVLMAHVNNYTASIQCRLMGLTDSSPVLRCCHLAAYICSVMLCCTVWCALVIPPHVSSQLLFALQQANDDPIWNDHHDLLLWLLYIGGAFAPAGLVRSDYIILLRLNNAARFGDLYRSWPELLEVLKQFIWSEKAFMSQVKALWEETYT